jgi:transcriptional regulator with XRE-family HTH domain
MTTTQVLRDKLGLSQENMAYYLKITLSQLALYETGRRDLPTHALVKISEIFLYTEQSQKNYKIDNQLLKSQELKTNEVLNLLSKELEYKQIKAQRLLDKIQKKYNQSIELYLLAQHLQNSNKEQSTIFLQLASTGLEKYGVTQKTKQIIILEGIKSQLKCIDDLKKSKK